MSKRGTAILDEPEQEYASAASRSGSPRRTSSQAAAKARHDYSEDFAGSYGEDEEDGRRRQPVRTSGLKLKLRAKVPIPRSLAGRIATGVALLVIAGAGIALLLVTRTFLLHDARFMIQSPASIEIQGNKHLTRAQLLGIFGEDIERNIFRISLVDRQAALEQLPWVRHATTMRLLPGRIRVSIDERTPIAFVRQGSHIGLVDSSGVLLDMAPSGTAAQTEPHYSFPVVTGIAATDPESTRIARMKIFERFTADLDSSGEKISEVLSEVDLSNPEDIKALIPANSSEILVHFGDDHFLERYRRFQQHLPEWHQQYPNLASVDMRYEREVVLDMANSAAARGDAAAAMAKSAPAKSTVAVKPVAAKPAAEKPSLAHPAAKPPVKAAAKSRTSPSAKPTAQKLLASVTRPHTAPASKPVTKPTQKAATAPTPHPTAGSPQTPSAPSASAAARSGYPATHPAKPAAGKPAGPADSYHPPQVPTR